MSELPPTDPTATCATCAYFQPHATDPNARGECRRYPPAFEGPHWRAVFPPCHPSTWCGEHPERQPKIATLPAVPV